LNAQLRSGRLDARCWLGYFAIGESISWRDILEALVICSALLLIDGRVLNLFRR
jgi:hypothetical protein